MEHENKYTILEQEIKRIKQSAIPILTRNNSEVSHLSQCVNNVVGVVKLLSAPHFGLVLDTSTSEQHFDVPVVIVDCARHTKQWILSVGKKVWISQLMVVFERFQNFNGCKDLECVNVLIMWENVKILDDSTTPQDQLGCPRNQPVPTVLKSHYGSSNTYRIMVHHVSSPFHIDRLATTFCLLLISYTNKNLVETKLWLVLKEEQVAWKEFFVPHREYLIVLPQMPNQFWFDVCRKPLKEIFPSDFNELDVLYHHKKLLPMLDGAMLPSDSKIFLTCNTQFSECVYKSVSHTSNLWFSCNEADYADTGLVTLYGQVGFIKYDTEVQFKSCYLCTRAKVKQPSLSRPSCAAATTTTQSWLNPWTSTCSLEREELISLPTAESGSGVMKTGVPGKLVQILKLRDVVTGEEQSVYVKHSYMPLSQQMCRLSSKMVICLTHLNRRCSSRGKYYYTTTVLTSVKVLSIGNDLGQNEYWGVYGLNHSTMPYADRMWGVFETINLNKVSISAKCINCGVRFYRGSCSDECSLPSPQTSAIAIGRLQVILDEKTISMEKVLIKDNFVRELLCIPEHIWQILLETAVEDELICFFNDQSANRPPHSSHFCELFIMYCHSPKPNSKFYISVKKMTSNSDNEPFYYCINLKPVEESRLKIVAELTKKCTTK